jgi:hypothetical protein
VLINRKSEPSNCPVLVDTATAYLVSGTVEDANGLFNNDCVVAINSLPLYSPLKNSSWV